MNYRHDFHAGNFADLVKHAALCLWLDRLLLRPAPLHVVDTHAGAGLYQIDAAVRRSDDARAGVTALAGGGFGPLFGSFLDSVRALNGAGVLRAYPGSPLLAARRLRPADQLDACELEPEVHARLERSLTAFPVARARAQDGFAFAAALPRPSGFRLHLIDPPFEAADDYDRIAALLEAVAPTGEGSAALVWTPLKDLETLDALVRRIEARGLGFQVVETRLRPLTQPLRMNGCALLLFGATQAMAQDVAAIGSEVAARLGDAGGGARLWRAGP